MELKHYISCAFLIALVGISSYSYGYRSAPKPEPKTVEVTVTVTKYVEVTPAPVHSTSDYSYTQPVKSQITYIANKKTKKFHKSTCSSVNDMKQSNKVSYSTRDECITKGYVPCKRCNP